MEPAPETKVLHPALHDHARLPEMFERLEDERDLNEVRRRLTELRAFLVRHFEDETGPGGLYDELLRLRPANQRVLTGLAAEHDVALSELDRLVQLIGQLQDGVPLLISLLRRHEQLETRLMGDTYLTDFGISG